MRILITGATGFVGSHLIEYLLSVDEVTVYATRRRRSNIENVKHLLNLPRVKWVTMDITDSHSVTRLMTECKPDWCFHLCAQSFVPASWNAPQETMTTNVVGTINLMEAARAVCPEVRIQIAGSSEEYGMVKEDEIPITEANPLRPMSPYAVSKVAEDLLGYQYFMSYGLHVVRTRGFNHTGPRRGEMFVCSNFARQIVEMEKGKRDNIIRVGNLDAERDFTDVRDMVRAYRLSLEKGKDGEVYNISSGRCFSMRQVLDMLIRISGIKVKVEQDPERMRPSDVPVLLGDSMKFQKETGWKPEIPFEKTLKDIIDYWREIIN